MIPAFVLAAIVKIKEKIQVLKKEILKYEYFFPLDNPETVLLIDGWENKEALCIHHKSEMMQNL